MRDSVYFISDDFLVENKKRPKKLKTKKEKKPNPLQKLTNLYNSAKKKIPPKKNINKILDVIIVIALVFVAISYIVNR